jgi:predicted dehydrogenase/threonine dehydrogenase-like Zn-dependent dehydrogenase
MKQIFLQIYTGEIIEVESIPPTNKDNFVVVESIFTALSSGTEKFLTSFANKSLLEKALVKPDQVSALLDKIKADGLLNAFDSAFKKLNDPLPLGYSGVGKVISIGKGVHSVDVGDFVAMAGQSYHAEINRVNKNLIARIPNKVEDLKPYSLCALGAIAIQSIHQSKVIPGETVAVIGLGLIGQITSRILHSYGCDVIGFDINDRVLNGTKLKSFINSNDKNLLDKTLALTNNIGVDKVIITASTDSVQPIEIALNIARERAIICMVGVTKMEIDRKLFYDKELSFVITRSYGPGRYDENYENKGFDYPIGYVRFTEGRNLQEFVRLLSEKRIILDDLITHTFDFKNYKEAYDLISTNKNKENFIAVIFRYDLNDSLKLANKVVFTKKISNLKDKISIGLIGSGDFTRFNIIPTLKKTKSFYLHSISSTGGVSISQALYNNKFHIATNNYKDILSNNEIDLVIVSTQHNTHAKFVIESLNSGKSVFCEKPLCLNLNELDQIKKTLSNSKGNLFVGLNRRFSPFLKILIKKFPTSNPKLINISVNAGKINNTHWSKDDLIGGGRMIGECIHFVDLAQAIDGTAIKNLKIRQMQSSPDINQDNFIINILFESGSLANIIYSSLGSKKYPKEKIQVFSNGQVFEIDNFLRLKLTGPKSYTLSKLRQNKGAKEIYLYVNNVLKGESDNLSINQIINNHEKLLEAMEDLNNGKT